MNCRERIKAIIAGEPADRCGFWMGNPHHESWTGIHAYFGTKTEEELRVKLGDDCRWICPQFYPDVYQDPKGLALFDAGLDRSIHTAPPLAHCETIAEIEAFPWPKPEYLHFDSCLRDLENAGDVYRMSGFWTCFYHNIADLFGMEEYFIKMYTHPEVIQAVTDKVCEFYYAANEKFFNLAGNMVDGYFFGNDFGTQLDLICGPEQFDEFILPWFQRFTAQGHEYGYQVILHSCGAISKVINRLIDSGVNCLHPLQALAANMSAEDLAENYKGRIAFLGGVDTQYLLVHGTPTDIRDDIRRIKQLLGPGLIISPSHEAILPNVPPANIQAMAEAVAED